ncbi:motile sperm domain-containing protein 2-like isoform X1 [Dendronephthya gigantea]|uniref:motile sperm domain-containing protein 2-like isoform X1 n=1 Tax=Dendronephthya gigantea TaxID=151771 RepID=UPI0010692EE6|nr:motile sperm domain-containing protein 2-like isoform X1 [Dendronephthya gigantea]
MASGATGSRPYMELVAELRRKFLEKHYASEPSCYDARDISRVKSDDLFVQQYLVGQDGNVDKAFKLMVEALVWRQEFGINDISLKDVPEEILKSGYLYTYGKDKNGAKLVFITVAKFIKGDEEKLLGYKKLLAYTFETIQREKSGQRLSLVNNCKDAGFSNVDTDFRNFVSFVQSTAYPDLLENAYMLSLPILLQGIWKIFQIFIGSRLSSKYIFTTAEELSPRYIDKDQLPLAYGGPSFEYKYPSEEKT